MSELLPCPFCGGEAETWDGTGVWHVFCTNKDCAAMGSPCLTEAEAIAAWNTRSYDYRQAAEYWQRMYEEAFAKRTCKVEGDYWHDHGGDGSDTYEYVLSCGHSVEWLDDDDSPKYCPRCGARIEVSE